MITVSHTGPLHRLTASDRFLMWDDYGWSSDIGALAVLARTEVEIVFVFGFLVIRVGDGHGRATRAEPSQLGLFDVRLGTARPRQDGFHELLVERICWHPFLLGCQA